ncbi:hypothetical protein P879_04577 [Paragonimus westermani]|uniref:Uncharacterized protein n=1 Tax=Paragonimus westermani TaxID=34504 RepID=A0A8T0DMF4_9TREM|nr:hypothetical protein P879_04577 [Paragonimus westermani]
MQFWSVSPSIVFLVLLLHTDLGITHSNDCSRSCQSDQQCCGGWKCEKNCHSCWGVCKYCVGQYQHCVSDDSCCRPMNCFKKHYWSDHGRCKYCGESGDYCTKDRMCCDKKCKNNRCHGGWNSKDSSST